MERFALNRLRECLGPKCETAKRRDDGRRSWADLSLYDGLRCSKDRGAVSSSFLGGSRCSIIISSFLEGSRCSIIILQKERRWQCERRLGLFQRINRPPTTSLRLLFSAHHQLQRVFDTASSQIHIASTANMQLTSFIAITFAALAVASAVPAEVPAEVRSQAILSISELNHN